MAAVTCPECGRDLVGLPPGGYGERPLRVALQLHCPVHGKPAYNDPSSKAFARRIRDEDMHARRWELSRRGWLALWPLLGLVALVKLGEAPAAIGALVAPPLAAAAWLPVTWRFHRRGGGGPYAPWLARRATSHPQPAAWLCVGVVATSSLVGTRSVTAAAITTAVYAGAIAVTWRPNGPLRRWALAHREPSLFEMR